MGRTAYLKAVRTILRTLAEERRRATVRLVDRIVEMATCKKSGAQRDREKRMNPQIAACFLIRGSEVRILPDASRYRCRNRRSDAAFLTVDSRSHSLRTRVSIRRVGSSGRRDSGQANGDAQVVTRRSEMEPTGIQTHVE